MKIQTSRKKRPLDRSSNPMRDARLIIIATEGRKTEEQYFRLFRSRRVQIIVLPTGKDNRSSPLDVLERLDKINEEMELDSHDELWLMIDVDRWPTKNLKKVTKSAFSKKYSLAISNPCFEVWLLCHFQSLPSNAKNCDIINNNLRKTLGGSYNKNNLEINAYKGKVTTAIKHAKSADDNPQARWPSCVGSHVYKVVELIQSLQL